MPGFYFAYTGADHAVTSEPVYSFPAQWAVPAACFHAFF